MSPLTIDATGSDLNADWIKTIGDYQAQDLAAHEAIEAGQREKHLPGQHDQSTHGSWAKGRQAAGSEGARRPAEFIGNPNYRDDRTAAKGAGWFIVQSEFDDLSNNYKFHKLHSTEEEIGDILLGSYSDLSGSDDVFTLEGAGKQKDKIVRNISDSAGITYDQANAIIKSWAESSNDSRYTSLLTQKIAAEEFGIELSDWQKNNLEYVTRIRRDIIGWANKHPELVTEYRQNDEKYDLLTKVNAQVHRELDTIIQEHPDPDTRNGLVQLKVSDLNGRIDSIQHEFKRLAARQRYIAGEAPKGNVELPGSFKTPFENGFGEFEAGSHKDNESAIRAVVKSMYAETQRQFRDAGIKYLVIYRGVGFNHDPGFKLKDIADLTQNALESWSLRYDIAEHFGRSKPYPLVLGMKIPVERIFSTARSGFGCLEEFEVITMNGIQPDQVAIVDVGKESAW